MNVIYEYSVQRFTVDSLLHAPALHFPTVIRVKRNPGSEDLNRHSGLIGGGTWYLLPGQRSMGVNVPVLRTGIRSPRFAPQTTIEFLSPAGGEYPVLKIRRVDYGEGMYRVHQPRTNRAPEIHRPTLDCSASGIPLPIFLLAPHLRLFDFFFLPFLLYILHSFSSSLSVTRYCWSLFLDVCRSLILHRQTCPLRLH